MSNPGGNITFDKLLNFRDVGATVNQSSGSQIMKPGVLYRSSKPDEATTADRKRIVDEYHVKVVMDLRTETEHIEAMKKNVDEAVPSAPAVVPKNVEKPLRVEDLVYKNVNLNGDGYRKGMMKHLSYLQQTKLVGLFAIGKRKEAISILAKNIMLPRGVAGLAEDTLQYCTKEMKQVFDILADEKNYPMLLHCTQGKDRTGIISLLLELLCGVPENAISDDYVLSEKGLEPDYESRLEEITSVGLPAEFLKCPPEFAGRIMGYLGTEYGGVVKYLEKCGVDAAQQQKIKNILMVTPS